jgi:hypothetical protein
MVASPIFASTYARSTFGLPRREISNTQPRSVSQAICSERLGESISSASSSGLRNGVMLCTRGHRAGNRRPRLHNRGARHKRADHTPAAHTIDHRSIPDSRSPPVPLKPSSIHRPQTRFPPCLQCVAVSQLFNCDTIISPGILRSPVHAHARA